jgi:hypothetical protein
MSRSSRSPGDRKEVKRIEWGNLKEIIKGLKRLCKKS